MYIRMQHDENSRMQYGEFREKERGKNATTIQAAQLNLGQDTVTMKKVQAQKKALKTVMDTFSGEQSLDNSIKDHQAKARELTDKANNALTELNKIEDLKSQLRETYEIKDGSQEQKDLELLEKQQRIVEFKSREELTEEEKKQLEEMGPVTEYQSAILDYNKISNTWQKIKDDAQNAVTYENRAVDAIKLEQVKNHVMVDAEKTADKIMEHAAKEIAGILLQEGKEHIDEELEKDRKEAEEKAKEVEEKQQEQEKAKENNKTGDESVEVLNQVAGADNAQDKLQREIQVMLNNQKLLEEDLKGISVNQQL